MSMFAIYAFMGACLGILPFLVVGFLVKNRHRMEEKDFSQKFNTLWLGVRTDEVMSVIYNGIFMLRRLIIVLLAVYGQKFHILIL